MRQPEKSIKHGRERGKMVKSFGFEIETGCGYNKESVDRGSRGNNSTWISIQKFKYLWGIQYKQSTEVCY